jgi:hypothetical protein
MLKTLEATATHLKEVEADLNKVSGTWNPVTVS